MASNRFRVLLSIAAVTALLAAFVLWRVRGAIVLSLATAVVLLPVHRWLCRRRLSSFWSATFTTVAGFVYIVLLFAPVGFVLYVRRKLLVDFITNLPETLTITVFGMSFPVEVAAVQNVVVDRVTGIAFAVAADAPYYLANFVVFGFVLFAVLFYHSDVRALARTISPPEYYDVLDLVVERVEEVLIGYYALALLGATITYVGALLVFSGLDYSVPFALALLAGLLYILPVVSPALLVIGLAVLHVIAGEVLSAAYILGFGGVGFVALPAYVVRSGRAAMGNPAPLSSTVYFVGFVGGWLTIGLVGLVLGPLVLAVGLTLIGQFESTDWSAFTQSRD